MKRKYGDKEDIKIEASMFDGAVPARKSDGVFGLENVKLHLTMIVNISRKESGNVLEIMCSVWPDSIEIDKLYILRPQMPAHPYGGPDFKYDNFITLFAHFVAVST